MKYILLKLVMLVIFIFLKIRTNVFKNTVFLKGQFYGKITRLI